MWKTRPWVRYLLGVLCAGAILVSGVEWEPGALAPGIWVPEAGARSRSRRRAAPMKAEAAPDDLGLLDSAKSAGKPPPAPKEPAPTGEALKSISLPNAPGVKPLTPGEVEGLPLIRVPAKQIQADLATHCETAWFSYFVQGKKIGYVSDGCRVRLHNGKDAVEQFFTLSAPNHGVEHKGQSMFLTDGLGVPLSFEVNAEKGGTKTHIEIQPRGKGYRYDLEVTKGGDTKRDRRTLGSISANLGDGELAFLSQLRRGKLKPGARFRYVWFDPEERDTRTGGLQLLATGTVEVGGKKILVHKVEYLLLGKNQRAESYLDETCRQIVSRPNKGILMVRDTEADAQRVGAGFDGSRPPKKGGDSDMMAWITANLETVIVVVVLILVFGSGGIVTFIKNARKGGATVGDVVTGTTVEKKRKGVGATLAAHLVRRRFVVGSSSDSLWSFDEDDEDNKHLDPSDRAKMGEIFTEKGLFGYHGDHFVKVAAEGWSEEPQRQFEIQLYWDNHKTDPEVKLALDTQGADAPTNSGRQRFNTGNPGFDGLFVKRHATAHAAERLAMAGPALNVFGEFSARYRKDLVRMEVDDTLEVTFHDRVLVGADNPIQALDELLATLVGLAVALETNIDPSFVPKPPPREDVPRYAAVEVLTNCPKCRSGLPLNGPMKDLVCPACMSEFSVASSFWDLLETPEKEFRKGQGGFNRNMNTDFRWRAARPTCSGCSQELPVDDIPVGANSPIFCPACGHATDTYPAPDWLRGVVPKAEQIFGAERSKDDPAGQAVMRPNQQSASPVVMGCPQCGGALTITGDMQRTIKCGFCQVDVFLPDELWRRLHPVKTAASWYVRFQPKY